MQLDSVNSAIGLKGLLPESSPKKGCCSKLKSLLPWSDERASVSVAKRIQAAVVFVVGSIGSAVAGAVHPALGVAVAIATLAIVWKLLLGKKKNVEVSAAEIPNEGSRSSLFNASGTKNEAARKLLHQDGTLMISDAIADNTEGYVLHQNFWFSCIYKTTNSGDEYTTSFEAREPGAHSNTTIEKKGPIVVVPQKLYEMMNDRFPDSASAIDKFEN